MKVGIAEMFESMQGEGTQGGMPALFVRLAGCNLWNGREEGREKGKGNCALWCDTNFLLDERITISELEERINKYCEKSGSPLIVFTGGEPTLYADKIFALCKALVHRGVMVSIETNGTKNHTLLDLLYLHKNGHVVCSPKRNRREERDRSFEHIVLKKCNDLKLVYPDNIDFDRQIAYDVLYLQPIDRDGDMGKTCIDELIEYATSTGAKISVQQHKLLELK